MPASASEALGGIPLFSHLSKRQLRTLQRSAPEDRYEAGTAIVREGGTTATLFVVLEGGAKVVRDGRTISRRRLGEFACALLQSLATRLRGE